RRRHTRAKRDWSSDVCSSDLGVDLAIDRGSRVVVLGLNGAGKTTLLRLLSGIEDPDTGAVTPGHGLKLGYYAQEHETLDTSATEIGRASCRESEKDTAGEGAD